jgi:hypothetical protein
MKCSTASEQRARHWAEFKCQREREDQQRRNTVIAEFRNDLGAMATEILRYRHAVVQLTDAISWTRTGAPFIAMGRANRKGRKMTDARDLALAALETARVIAPAGYDANGNPVFRVLKFPSGEEGERLKALFDRYVQGRNRRDDFSVVTISSYAADDEVTP